MKIAHVVTYVSPDGAFGGPVRVAFGQAAELASRGHDVTVYAASPDEVPRETVQDGYRLRTFPARRLARRLGFAGMYAPGLASSLRAELPRTDIVHVHLARDLVTLPAARVARRAGTPFVVQPHGMIDRSRNPLAWPVDFWETRVSLRDAAAVLVLTDQELSDIGEISQAARVKKIANGINAGVLPDYEDRPSNVLFLARLHPRKRPLAFLEMAELLNSLHGLDVTCLVAGPDEGEGPMVEAVIAASESRNASWIGAVDPAKTDDLLRQARVYVLPSVGEIFPMSVLEAFRAGTPVVTTDSLGIAESCAEYGAALVTDGSPAALAAAVARVLTEEGTAEKLRQGALEMLNAELSIGAVVDRLLDIYSTALAENVDDVSEFGMK